MSSSQQLPRQAVFGSPAHEEVLCLIMLMHPASRDKRRQLSILSFPALHEAGTI